MERREAKLGWSLAEEREDEVGVGPALGEAGGLCPCWRCVPVTIPVPVAVYLLEPSPTDGSMALGSVTGTVHEECKPKSHA